MRVENVDGAQRHHAVPVATICDDVLPARDLGEASLEVGERDGNGVRKVSRAVFVKRTNIDDRYVARADPLLQLGDRDNFEPVARAPIIGNDALKLGQAALGEGANRARKGVNVGVGEAAIDEKTLFAGIDELRRAKDLEMARGVGDREVCLAGEILDRPFGVDEEIDELEAARARECARDARELSVNAIFEVMVHRQ